MDTLAFGQFLREAREKRELSLDDAVKTLKIQRRILEAFEEGDFSQGGSPVQVRGMLRNYARFLRLDEDVVLEHYKTALIPPKNNRWRKKATEETQSVKPATQPRRDTMTIPLGGGTRRSGPRFAWVGGVLTTLMGFGLLAVIIFFVAQILNHTPPPDVDAQPTLNAQFGTLDPTLATATYTASWTPRPDLPTPTRLITIGDSGFTVDLRFVQRSWVRVLNDGEEVYTGIAKPDDTQSYTVKQGIEITLANAAAMELVINGETESDFGARGQQVLILVNSTGIQIIHPDATATVDPNRIISPEALTITETPDPALVPTAAETPTLVEPTVISPEILPSETPAQAANAVSTETPLDVASSASSTPNPATLGLNLPTLTPFTFMADTSAPQTTEQVGPEPTLTPSLPAPTLSSVSPGAKGQPTVTPFAFMQPSSSQPTESSAEITSAATATPAPSSAATQASINPGTITPAATLRPSATASLTAIPALTATTTPNAPTAIVPLRITQAGLPTRKAP